jgi:hypothetical protein
MPGRRQAALSITNSLPSFYTTAIRSFAKKIGWPCSCAGASLSIIPTTGPLPNRLIPDFPRASIKAKKRQWDPPRRLARSKNAHNEKSRRSPTFASHEILDGSVHFLDVRGATESSLPNTAFQQQPALRPATETSERNTRAQSISPTPDECAAAEVLATMADGHIGGSQDSVLRMANLLSSHEGYVASSITCRTQVNRSLGGRLMSPPQSRYDQGARCRLHSRQ